MSTLLIRNQIRRTKMMRQSMSPPEATCQTGQFSFCNDHTCGIYRIRRKNCTRAANRIVRQSYRARFLRPTTQICHCVSHYFCDYPILDTVWETWVFQVHHNYPLAKIWPVWFSIVRRGEGGDMSIPSHEGMRWSYNYCLAKLKGDVTPNMKSYSADKRNEAVSESTRGNMSNRGQFTFCDDHTFGIDRIRRENCTKAANRIVRQIYRPVLLVLRPKYASATKQILRTEVILGLCVSFLTARKQHKHKFQNVILPQTWDEMILLYFR